MTPQSQLGMPQSAPPTANPEIANAAAQAMPAPDQQAAPDPTETKLKAFAALVMPFKAGMDQFNLPEELTQKLDGILTEIANAAINSGQPSAPEQMQTAQQ